MRLQIASRLAIFAVLELTEHAERQLTVAEIATKYGVSTHHLAKVMHELGRAGLARSVRGAGGGYQFCANARRTTLLDIIELFEELGPRGLAANEPGRGTGEAGALDIVLGEIDEAARATFGSITIATMRRLVERGRAPPVAAGRLRS
jgi:Rrf2 family nitric oxide-sensitive transcriptional repressor